MVDGPRQTRSSGASILALVRLTFYSDVTESLPPLFDDSRAIGKQTAFSMKRNACASPYAAHVE